MKKEVLRATIAEMPLWAACPTSQLQDQIDTVTWADAPCPPLGPARLPPAPYASDSGKLN